MRIKIWERNDFFQLLGQPRIEMDPAVVNLEEEVLVMVQGYYFNAEPCGEVTDIRLEDYEIVGEATFFEDSMAESVKRLVEHGYLRFGGLYTNVERTEEDGELFAITSCKLKAVSIVEVSKMPGYNPTNKILKE